MLETQSPPSTATRLPRMLRQLLCALWQLVQAGVLLYGLATTGYLLARGLVGEQWAVVAFANNFLPWWSLGGLLLGLVALFSHRRWLLAALQVPVILAFVVLYGPLLLPRDPGEVAGGGPALTIASYNTLSALSDPARVLDVVADLQTDVIGLQELGPDHADLLAAQLSGDYPYQALYPELPVHGVGLLSRYPILSEEVIRLAPGAMLTLRAELDIAGTPVTLLVTHPPTPTGFLSPVTYNTERRDAEIALLIAEHIRPALDGPLLVIGDFNLTDQSNAYRDLDALLDDAYRDAGPGLGFTFPASLFNITDSVPLLRIDFIWYNRHFVAREAWTGEDAGTSDHLPVAATLVLKTEPMGQGER
jgi:vancomycin resistance protein VanJ